MGPQTSHARQFAQWPPHREALSDKTLSPNSIKTWHHPTLALAPFVRSHVLLADFCSVDQEGTVLKQPSILHVIRRPPNVFQRRSHGANLVKHFCVPLCALALVTLSITVFVTLSPSLFDTASPCLHATSRMNAPTLLATNSPVLFFGRIVAMTALVWRSLTTKAANRDSVSPETTETVAPDSPQSVPPVSNHEGFKSVHLKARPRMWSQEENLCLWQESRPASKMRLMKGRTPNNLTLLISLLKKKNSTADTGSAETNV